MVISVLQVCYKCVISGYKCIISLLLVCYKCVISAL